MWYKVFIKKAIQDNQYCSRTITMIWHDHEIDRIGSSSLDDVRAKGVGSTTRISSRKKHANLRPAYKMDVSAGTLLQRIKIPISYMLTDIHVGSPLWNRRLRRDSSPSFSRSEYWQMTLIIQKVIAIKLHSQSKAWYLTIFYIFHLHRVSKGSLICSWQKLLRHDCSSCRDIIFRTQLSSKCIYAVGGTR